MLTPNTRKTAGTSFACTYPSCYLSQLSNICRYFLTNSGLTLGLSSPAPYSLFFCYIITNYYLIPALSRAQLYRKHSRRALVGLNAIELSESIIILMSEEIQTHILARFDIVKKIGSGAYGHVWKVIDKRSRKTKALKKNFDAFNNSTDAQRTYREIMFLLELSHPNIIKLEEVIRAENNRDIYLLFEHMDIDLYTLIREDILAERHRKYIFYQMSKALYYLHSAGLIHRDVKPSNVLVNENCDAKLCDFGLVRSIDDQTQEPIQMLTEYIATRWYRAPEILIGSRKYSKAIDIWSMGCMLAEMLRGKPLFAGTSTLNQIEKVLQWTGSPSEQQIKCLKVCSGQQIFKLLGKVKRVSHAQMVPTASEQCLDLINRMLQFNPDKRLTIQEILSHSYLSEFYNKQQLLGSHFKVKLPVDDNQRLSLKDYRGIIYEEIKKKNKANDPNTTTLYRIKNTVRKSNPKKNELGEQRAASVQDDHLHKKSFYKRDPVLLGRGRNVKTIEKEWDPIEAKKSLLSKQGQKFLNSKYDNEWVKKKRSTTEAHPSRKGRIIPSRVDNKNRVF